MDIVKHVKGNLSKFKALIPKALRKRYGKSRRKGHAKIRWW